LIERQRQIEHFPGIDLLVQNKVDQLREFDSRDAFVTTFGGPLYLAKLMTGGPAISMDINVPNLRQTLSQESA
jgi:hypothetical protein